MADDATPIPRSFRIISSVALAWNLVGIGNWFRQVSLSPDDVARLPEAQRVLLENYPMWATTAFAVAAFAGALGCVLLLLRNSWAVPAFLLSLAGILVQMYHNFVIADALDVAGPAAAVLPTLIVAIGVALIWYARVAKERGWLR